MFASLGGFAQKVRISSGFLCKLRTKPYSGTKLGCAGTWFRLSYQQPALLVLCNESSWPPRLPEAASVAVGQALSNMSCGCCRNVPGERRHKCLHPG